MGATPLTDHYPLWQGPPYRGSAAVSPPQGPTRARVKPRVFGPRELGLALLLPVLTDIALWSGERFAAGGLSLGLLLVLVPAVLFIGAGSPRRSLRSWKATGRLGIIVALLTLLALRAVFEPTPIVVASGVLLVVSFALALRGRRVFVPMVFAAVLAAVTKLPSRIEAALAGTKKLFARTRVAKVSVLPVVVPAALVTVFVAVFALGNPVMAHGLGVAFDALTDIVAIPSIGRILFFLTSLCVGIGLLRPAYRLERAAEKRQGTAEASTTSLLVARNALVALNALFLVEIALDARFLWIGSPPQGMDTQRYAHEGAFWLTVALVLLTAVVGVMFKSALADDPRARTTRWLAYGWMAQGLVLSAGTYRRIAIHVARSGLSDLRIVGIFGTTLVAIGVVLVGLKLRDNKTFAWLVRRQLDALAIAVALYAIAPTHLLSARVNVARIQSGETRPVLHVFRQSHETESAAAFLPLLDHPDPRIRQGVAALLDDERERLHDAASRKVSWKQRDLATALALRDLDRAAPRIANVLDGSDPDVARATLLDLVHEANEYGP